jgi:arylsulfatase A-like enzyme
MLLAACGGGRSNRLGAPDPNVVLIVVDTLRADRLPFYGNETDTAPFLSELASRSTVFETAFSPSGWTAPATATLFTSLYPNQHGVWTGFRASERMGLRYNRIPAAAETLPEVMQRLGYRTFGVADNINIGEEMGFSDGFDRFERHPYESALTLQRTVNSWREDLASGEKYFLYLHFIDPHTPYRARQEFMAHGSAERHVERLESWNRGTPGQRRWVEENLSLYDSEIGLVDQVIAEMFESFGWRDNTLLIVTADHGEEFYDHGNRYHGDRLYQELVRVPLLVYFPQHFAPARVDANVGLVDVLPTIRDLLGDDYTGDNVGLSLLPLLGGGSEESLGEARPLFGLYRNEHPELEEEITRSAVVFENWKYIRLVPEDREELYDLAGDPSEQRDVALENPNVVRRLRRRLREFETYAPRLERSYYELDQQSEEMNKHLRALGYVE